MPSSAGVTLCLLEKAALFLPGDASRRLILKGISWDIRRGEHTVLTGRNGAGKTTLLRLLSGEAWTTAGSIRWRDGEDFSRSRVVGQAVTSLVSPAQQERVQRYEWGISGRELILTGYDGTPMLYTDMDDGRVREADRLAAELGATDLLELDSRELSQGQLRLLLLARAMIKKPDLLLLDECFDGLDAAHRTLFSAALERIAPLCTVIMTTHRESTLPSWIRKTLYIEEGELVSAEVYREAVRLYAPETAEEEEAEVSAASVADTSEPVIRVENASVYLKGRKVLHDINWYLRQGEHWHIAGPNGSGKSTFLRMLAGDENAAWPGKVSFTLPKASISDIPFVTLRRRVRLVSDQAQAQYEYDVTCLELVLSGFENTVGLYREFSAEEKAEATRHLRRVGLEALADRRMSLVSTGQLRRVFLARALMGYPVVLLLDEACTGLDEESRREYLKTLAQLAEEGMSLVFVSHYEEDIPDSVNRRAVLKDGRMEILP